MKRINRNRILLLVFLTTCIFIGINILQNFTLLNSTNEYLKNDEENTLNNLKTSGYWSVPYIHIKNDNWSATSVPWIQNRTGTWNDPHIIENVITTDNIGGHCILIEDSTDFFIIRNCTAVTSGTAYTNAGIKLDTTNNGALIDNNCSSNNFGIFLVDSNNNTISGNIANDNTEFGILLDNSEDNIISSGTIENNRFGIELNSGSDHNDVTENYIYNNAEYGLYIYFSGNPPFNYDGYNNVWKNVIKSNGKTGISPYGIQIRSSSKNVIWENIIEDNDDIGIGCASFSSENLIYKNYFIGNSLHANDVGSNNNWDNSIIGNYWDNYTGSDSDGDGIGDSPYTYITGSANSNDTLPIYGDPFHDGSKVYINGNLDSGVNSWNWTSTRAWCSGSGLSGDPYIISDLVIDGGGSGSCITIGNSTVYFEIENCTVYKSGTGSTDAGIKLIDVDNSKLLENNCSINKYGIYLELSDKNDILENFLGYNEYGLYLNNSNNNYIAENTFKSNTQNAFEETSSGNTFENNYVLPPTKVYNVDSPQSDIPVYRLGDTIEITIEFSDIVYVTGTPQLTLETGDDDAIVNYVSGSGTTTLSFNYTVGLDHYSTDLDYTSTNALSGTIKGVVGNDADLTLPAPGSEGSLGYNKDFVVDAKTPSVSDVSSTSNGIFNVGANIDITITFTEAVFIVVTPELTLETNTMPNGVASYSSGNGTAALTFTYTVAAGHATTDLDYESTTALSGTLEDSDGLTADLTLPDPGTAGSLGANNNIIIDTIDPSSPTGLSASPSSWTNIDDFDLSWTNPADTSGIVGAYYKLDTAPGSDTDGTYVVGADIEAITGIAVGSEGSHTIYVWLRDAAGNINYLNDATTVVYLDTTDPSSPTGLSASPSSWTNIDDFDLSWNNPGDTSGIAGAYYKLDTVPGSPTDGTYIAGADIETIIGIVIGSDGTHTIYVWLRDTAGNVDHTTYATVQVYLDTTDPSSPTGLSANPSSWTNLDDFDLSWNNPADLSGIVGAYYKLDSAPGSPTDGTYVAGSDIETITGIVVGSDGTHTVYVWLRDAVGNVDHTTYATVQLYLDTTDPSSPTGLSASPSSWTNIDDFDLSWNNPGDTSGIAGAYYKLDSVPGSPTDGTYVAGSDIETITGIVVGSDGTHTVYVWLRDAAGNVDHTTYVTVQVYLDTTDPSSPTGLSASPSSWTNIDDFDLSWNNPADLSGIVGVYYKLDTTPSTPTDGTYVPGADIESLTGITVGTDGIHTIYVWLVDDAGNVDHMNYASTLLYLDITNPSVISISSTTSNGTYGLNVEIYITITFSEPVYVTGTTPTLTLETNSIPDGIAYYTSGNGTDTLTFTYTVGLGHSSSDLDYVSTNALSGTIKDIVGNDADPTLPSPGALGSLGYNKDIIIETTPPVIINVSSSISNGTYGIGEVIDIIVYFSEPVSVTGTPQLTLETGLIDAVIDYVGGSGTDALIFGYVVASGHASSDLGYVSIDALSGIIKDIAGNDANMTLPAPGASGSLSANKDIIIETIQPDITSVSSTKPDGTYGEGETINIVITFSEVVYVTGIPQLTLETGSIDAVINYVSGSGTDTLIFSYTVASGHNSDDLEYISTDALSLNGGTIKDSVGNDAILTLPAPGTSGSLSFNKDIIISTYVPQDNFGLIMTIVIGSSAGVAIVAVITILLVKRRRKKW